LFKLAPCPILHSIYDFRVAYTEKQKSVTETNAYLSWKIMIIISPEFLNYLETSYALLTGRAVKVSGH